MFKRYTRKGSTMMRKYEPGEDLKGISVSESVTPTFGGMIAMADDDPNDQWYVDREYFKKHYDIDSGHY